MDTQQKLTILTESSRFDLACACKYKHEPGRTKDPVGRWIYPAVLPSGQKTFLLKILQSNACVNDCRYCPFNQSRDIARCSFPPEMLARIFMRLHQTRRVDGLFLSSGVAGNPDTTMQRMLDTVWILRRREQFRGYIHLKVIPGASPAAIEQAVQLGTRVSVNMEAPTPARLAELTSKKNFHRDILSAMRLIDRCAQEKRRWGGQTTQFVVGAAGETDQEIVQTSENLYHQYRMRRVYYSAFQDPARQEGVDVFDDPDMPLFAAKRNAGQAPAEPASAVVPLMREHRLYQADFLLRKYGFKKEDLYFDPGGNLPLWADPKQIWASRHPEFFPVRLNGACYEQLLRVPGIGPVLASRLLHARRGSRFQSLDSVKQLGLRDRTIQAWLTLD